jgi:hypothetical protein
MAPIMNRFSQAELQQGKQLADSMIAGQKGTINKVTSIVKFLYDRFYEQMGTPTLDFSTSTPMIQYRKLCSSKNEHLWCGNFAVMVAFFCWSEGIVTRNVEIIYPGDHHVLNESYIPETRSWIVTDATNNLLLIKDKNDNYLNLASLKDSLQKKSQLVVIRSVNALGSIEQVELNYMKMPVQFTAQVPFQLYYTVYSNYIYKSSNKIKRYFMPTTWYEIYDLNKRHSNFGFYFKQFLSLIWVASMFLFLFISTIFHNDRSKKY